MNMKKILISGPVLWITNGIIGWLTCGWLFNWVYQLPPNIWLGPEEMMKPANMIATNVFGLVQGFIFSLVFIILYQGIPGQGIKKGIIYGLLIWLVGALVGIGTMPFYMTIATGVVIYWLIQALVMNIIDGLIVSSICKQ